MVLVTAALLFHCAKALRRLWWTRLPVYATPVVVGGRLRGDAWCGMQLSTPQFRGVLHKPRIGIVPDPFLVKAVWLRETMKGVCGKCALLASMCARCTKNFSSVRACVRACVPSAAYDFMKLLT